MLKIYEDNGIVNIISELMQNYNELLEDLEDSLAEIHDPREESQIILLSEECGHKLGILSDLYSHIRRQSQCHSLYGNSFNVLCADEDDICNQKPTQDVENTGETYAEDADNGGVDGVSVHADEDGIGKEATVDLLENGAEQVNDQNMFCENSNRLMLSSCKMNQEMENQQMSVARTKTGDVNSLEIMHWIGEQYWNGEMKTFLRLVFDSGGVHLYQKH